MSSQNTSVPTSFAQGYGLSSSPVASGPLSSSSSSFRHPRKEILNYSAPWPVYGLDCEGRDYNPTSMSDWVAIAETNYQQYPVTRIKWEPYKGGHRRPYDLLATTGDYLRLWDLKDDPDQNESSNTIGRRHPHNKGKFLCTLTSFDGITFDPALIVTSSIDTTCTVWNVETQQAKTQLIAHDKECGCRWKRAYVRPQSIGNSTIIYETTSSIPGMQSSNPQMAAQPPVPFYDSRLTKLDPNYLSTFHMDSSSVQILDIRVPGIPISELRGHKGAVNCMAWSPIGSSEIATGSDDHQVFIWEDLEHHHGKATSAVTVVRTQKVPPASTTRVFARTFPRSQCRRGSQSDCMVKLCPDWIAVGFGRTVQALRL
ncbi:WD40-repeat-containing domain protein [Lobosporangium transversale]|uniref:WD40-repeat-containing domain protein n=1 Tax=Lobosporangium transversale TaxID=64571 RepID=A0A1Y2GI06_9FUNG|nr:WD40-repeat-containing domain protein [Lobosporangium transversale]ORZ11642.1 WD40-repeat-containing domain protein [Lobosporangium transversale]|eukprot:XP_021879739.1 WD40-repeat-containing domain protein [Lobosporangium transversale]